MVSTNKQIARGASNRAPSALEEWRPVVGFEGFYEVSNLGIVKGVTRIIECSNGTMKTIKGKQRKPSVNERGYLSVPLYQDNRPKNKFVHSLVLEAFVGPCPVGLEGCHNDGNPANNTLENLRWDTPSNNQLDRITHGTHNNANRDLCKRSHPFTGDNLWIDTKHNRRICRSCELMRKRLDKASTEAEKQKVSDDYYKKILEGIL